MTYSENRDIFHRQSKRITEKTETRKKESVKHLTKSIYVRILQ